MALQSIPEELEQHAASLGTDLYGVASAEEYQRQFPQKPSPYRFIEGARSIIVIGLAFTRSTMTSVLSPDLAGLEKRKEEAMTNSGPALGAERYFLGEENNMLIRETSYIAYNISKRLEREGCAAFYIPPFKFDPRFKTAPFYIMPAMYLAGMGQLGLNCCILTPEFGPNLLADIVITDKQLPAGKPAQEQACQKCMRCVESVIGMTFLKGTMSSVLRPDLSDLRSRADEGVTGSVRPLGAERYFLTEENRLLEYETEWMGSRLVRKLEQEGHSAFYFAPGKQDPRYRTALFYITPAAYLAGLGTLGLNCCIVNPEHGPRIFLNAVITDLELQPGQPLAEEACTHCNECVKACPAGALDGDGWKNVYRCAAYGCCGTCLAICPVGR